MDIWKHSARFVYGGALYVGLEVLFRGRSHGSMFLAGGSAFALLGRLRGPLERLPLLLRSAVGSGIITAVELVTGLVANRDYTVWDYRNMPLNYRGQICLPFSLLWAPLSLAAMKLAGEK